MSSRINDLDDRTIGFIAAGEVVERPAQVVKELIENALDAGGTRITVEVERGGFDLIRVQDDGAGIHPDDLRLAVKRHATSKLATEADLSVIHTLGFRGEALASIGMVSSMTVTSRIEGQDAHAISVEEGRVGTPTATSGPRGTRVSVEGLFQNQPARLAFQRRPQTEHARIVDLVLEHALAHPKVAFELRIDGRRSLAVPAGSDPLDRLHDLLGQQAGRMIPLSTPPLDEEAPGEERWSGWIAPPEVTRGRSDEIHVLVNGRPVASQPFLASVRRGYRTRLMQGRHPIAVLRLDLPPSEVDVNVHPTKREVRFRSAWRVMERLERCIAHSLESIPTSPDRESMQSVLGGLELNPRAPSMPEPAEEVPAWARTARTRTPDQQTVATPSKPRARPVSEAPSNQPTLPGLEVVPPSPALSSEERLLHRHAGTGHVERPGEAPALETDINDLPPLSPLAQFADSYILAQSGSELLLIDQHALHERIRYERLRTGTEQHETQHLIQPLDLDLDPTGVARLVAGRERLKDLGFQFSEADGSWRLEAVPTGFERGELKELIDDLLLDVGEDGQALDALQSRRDHVDFLRACRGAVKANERLTLPEMRRLLEDMRRIPNPWACVHGRPTALRIDLDALDDHFGRHG